MSNIHKNHIKIGDYIIQYEDSKEDRMDLSGYYIIGENLELGPYTHVFDAIEDVLQWQDN